MIGQFLHITAYDYDQYKLSLIFIIDTLMEMDERLSLTKI